MSLSTFNKKDSPFYISQLSTGIDNYRVCPLSTKFHLEPHKIDFSLYENPEEIKELVRLLLKYTSIEKFKEKYSNPEFHEDMSEWEIKNKTELKEHLEGTQLEIELNLSYAKYNKQ